MVRIHIAQIDYRPAYYDFPTNFLEEPTQKTIHTLGRLRRFLEIDTLLNSSLKQYLSLIEEKTNSILRFSQWRKADILVLPEYSIPLDLLPNLFQKSNELNLIIVAGTHRVSINDYTKAVYSALNLRVSDSYNGSAICPIFIPNRVPEVAVKSSRSKWEGSLNIPTGLPRSALNVDVKGRSVSLVVLICLDALNTAQLAQLKSLTNEAPSLVVCPSLSPSTSEFEGAARLVSLMPALFAYANCAKHGGSQFYIPEKWHSYLRGKKSPRSVLQANIEGVVECDVNLQNLAIRQGTFDPGTEVSYPLCFPIIGAANAPWTKDYSHYRQEALKALQGNEISKASEWLDLINTEPNMTNELLRENCKALRHGILPMYDGDVDYASALMAVVSIAGQDAKSLKNISRQTAGAALDLLSDRLKSISAVEMEEMFSVIKSLKTELPDLHPMPLDSSASTPILGEPKATLAPRFQGDEDLDRRFQNRGTVLDDMRSIFSNPEIRVVHIAGPFGIGKSALIKIVFRKQLADWRVIDISIPRGGKVPRLLGEISHKLGMAIDTDALASSSQKVFRSRVRDVLGRFFREPKRALVIDDLNSILADASVRDINQLKAFFDTALDFAEISGGKIIAVSSRFIPRFWIAQKGVHEIRLKGLPDVYIARVLEYDMRQSGKVDQETYPPQRQDVLELVHGNPLIAKLLVQIDGVTSFKGLQGTRIAPGGNVIRTLAASILSEMRLSNSDEQHLRQIAVFRLPVRLDILGQMPGKASLAGELRRLAERSVLAFDGSSVEMHEVVRRHFLSDTKLTQEHHQTASEYYKSLYELMKASGENEPAVIAEYAYHLALSGKLVDLQAIRPLTEELKFAARQLYRMRTQYELALRIYQTIHELRPDDLDVLAYIGRCFGRRKQWDDCGDAFRQAIEIARTMGRDCGWLYRDWGHILARYQRYGEAKEALAKAEQLNPDDASIVAPKAYMAWKEGDYQVAEDLFERALTINSNHTYSLKYYSVMLKNIGRIEYSNKLKARLDALEEGMTDDLFVLDELDDDDEI